MSNINDKTFIQGCQIIIELSDPMYFSSKHASEKEWHNEAAEVIDQIKRHVDGFSGYRAHQIDVRFERNCNHCLLLWETDEKGIPQCCDEAQAEWQQEHQAQP